MEKWGVKTLEELLLLCDSGTWGEPATEQNYYPILRSTNISTRWELDLDGDIAYRSVSQEHVIRYALEPGDIIVTKSSGSSNLIGQAALFQVTPKRRYLFSNFTQRLRPDQEQLIPRYLHFYLQSPLARRVIEAMHRTTSGLRNLILADYKAQFIPIPYPDDPARSLSEQRRIVARLEALLGEVREMRALQAQIEADVGRLMEAVLAEVFPDPHKPMPETWRVWKVEQISRKPQYGYTQSASTEAVGPKFLRITDIQNGIVNWDSVPFCEIDAVKLARYQLETGDIVFARSGATTGKTYLVKNPPQAVFASYLIRLQIERITRPEFVYWFFQSPYYWRQITLRGGAQPNMNAELLKQVRIPIPDDAGIQQRLVAQLENVSAEVAALRADVEHDATLLDALEQTILAQAFHGEL